MNWREPPTGAPSRASLATAGNFPRSMAAIAASFAGASQSGVMSGTSREMSRPMPFASTAPARSSPGFP